MKVDDQEFELSNNDVILAKPGTVVRKTWRVKNAFEEMWDPETKVVSVTEGLNFEGPELKFPSPGNRMDLSVKIYIPESAPEENFVF